MTASTIRRHMGGNGNLVYIVKSLKAAGALQNEKGLWTVEAPQGLSLLERRKEAFRSAQRKFAASNHHTVNLGKEPYVLAHLGDPHLDDDGTDIEALEQDLNNIKNTPRMYAGCVGDTLNLWVGRLQSEYANQTSTLSEAWELAEWFFGSAEFLYVTSGNHCHDEATEALTKRGWVPGLDVQEDDEVLTFNTDSGAAEWKKVQHVVHKNYAGDMVHLKSAQVDALVTPEHRVLGRHSKRSQMWSYLPANKLNSTARVPTCGTGSRDLPGISDSMLQVVGWFLTDGCISGTELVITQSKEKNFEHIKRALEDSGMSFSENVRASKVTEIRGVPLKTPAKDRRVWRIRSVSQELLLKWLPNKSRVPDWVSSLSDRQFDVLLDTMKKGNGSYTEGIECFQLSGPQHILEGIQAAAVCHSWRASLTNRKDGNYILNLSRGTTATVSRNRCKTLQYEGKVWCLNVENSNFMVRRNGKCHFSGNCKWNNGTAVFAQILKQNNQPAAGEDIQLVIEHGQDLEPIKFHIRHDFPGNSQWNPCHGHMKAAYDGDDADVLVSGHRHKTGMGQAVRRDGSTALCLQVGSYKVLDDYAIVSGFRPHQASPCVCTLVQPMLEGPDRVQVFWSTAEARRALLAIS